MIWEYNSFSMEESSVDEKEGFQIGTMIMPMIFKGVHKWILRQVMDINYTSFIGLVYYWRNKIVLPNHTHQFHPSYHMLHLVLG